MNEKENMVACAPSADEWLEIVRSVRETAAQTAVECLDRESITCRKAGQDEREDRRQQEYSLIREALERYRAAPDGSGIREGLEYLMKKHGHVVAAARDGLYRERHNALVLKYMIKRPMTNVEIERRLGISDNTFKRQIEKGIRELAVLFFGGGCPER